MSVSVRVCACALSQHSTSYTIEEVSNSPDLNWGRDEGGEVGMRALSHDTLRSLEQKFQKGEEKSQPTQTGTTLCYNPKAQHLSTPAPPVQSFQEQLGFRDTSFLPQND